MLKIDNVTKKYSNGIIGIENFNLSMSDSEVVCIAGPNGSGKTTLINCILDIIPLSSGTITFDGIQCNKEEYKKNIAYVADETILIDSLCGEEYIDFIESMYGKKNKDKRDSLVELFGMGDALKQIISTYSHGMKKKLQLISAFMLESKLVILDEPTRGLDVESIVSLKKLMNKYNESGGSILMSTHNLIAAESFCKRFSIISQGHMIAEGTVEELRKKYDAEDMEQVFMKSSVLSERSERIEEIINGM
jgi:ABC-2 type transport system ATP-binding protein